MGLFDAIGGLLGIKSGEDAAREAAAASRAALAGYGGQANQLYGGYQTGALGALGEARTGALGELATGLGQQVGAYGQGLGAAQQGLTGALGAGEAGVAAYAPLSRLGESYAPAVNAYYQALGLQGPEGVTAAQNRFTTGPGYQFQVDEATRNAMANASRLGIAASGNTLDALRARAQGFAGQEYNQYLDRLAGFVNPQLQATTAAAQGVAGANRSLADIYTQGYGNLAGIYGNIGGAYGTAGTQRAGVQTGYGQDVTNVLGNVVAGQTQTARDIASGNIATNQQIAQAAQQDAANKWGLLGAGVGALGKAFSPAPTYRQG